MIDKSMFKIIRVISFIFLLFTIVSAELDLFLAPQNSFYSAAVKSLGGAGIALPVDITTGLINPALVYSHFQAESSRGAITAGYGRDSLFDKNILLTGIGYCNNNGAIAVFYRFLQDDNTSVQNEVTLNFSGMLFGPTVNENKSVDAGQVDIGVNIHYEFFSWKKRPLASLDTSADFINASIKQNRLVFDLGLYQSDIAQNFDFGLTFRNLLGYIWTKEKPFLTDSLQTNYLSTGDSIVNTIQYYSYANKKTENWLENEYRIMTVGFTYHTNTNGGANQISLPIDFEILGLFDKHIKNQYIFRGGISINLQKRFMINFGYSRAPGAIKSSWEEIKKVNVFSGGGGINIDPVALNFYISGDAFGTNFELKF